MNRIKHSFAFSMIALFLTVLSCGGPATSPEEQLAEKTAELESLQESIKDLQALVAKNDTTPKKRKTIPVTLDSVQVKSYTEYVDVQGEVQTKGNYIVTASQPGNLTTLNIREGQYVKKGDLLGQVDNSSIVSSISELQLQLDLAKDIFERRRKLWSQKIGSEMEYLQAKNNAESLEKSIATANTQLYKSRIFAPSNGVIESVNIKQGEEVSPGMPIATLIDVSNVQIIADVSEIYLANVKKGDELLVNIPALEMDTKAWISNIGSIVNPANRTFKIEARVSNKQGKLKPNLLAMIKIKKHSSKDGIVIPTQVIMKEGQTDVVYVLGEQGSEKIAVKKVIKVDRSASGESLISSGLNGNELLVSEGRNLVKNGSIITVQ